MSFISSAIVRRMSRRTFSDSSEVPIGTPAYSGSHGIRSYPRRRLNSSAKLSLQFWLPHSQLSTCMRVSTFFAISFGAWLYMLANQLSNCFLMALRENLSHSSPRPPPPVALTCPVVVCPMRRMCQRPFGRLIENGLSRKSEESSLPVRLIIWSLGMHSLSATGKYSDTRHTFPDLPSYPSIVGSEPSTMPAIFRLGFHFAASMSSEPGSLPSGVQWNLK